MNITPWSQDTLLPVSGERPNSQVCMQGSIEEVVFLAKNSRGCRDSVDFNLMNNELHSQDCIQGILKEVVVYLKRTFQGYKKR